MPFSLRPLSAGSAPLASAAARAAHPASVTWVSSRLSHLSFFSTPVGSVSAPAGGGGARRAARPSSPNGLSTRLRVSSTGRRRKAGARATSPASPMAVPNSWRVWSPGRALRSRAAASAKAPASPTYISLRAKRVTAGSAPAPSPSTSRSAPSWPAASELSTRVR
eukprot:scaffold35137_cov59-Phaeocystis_antarctica.AAC.2